MRDYISEKFKKMVHGADYNPDQWLDCPEILSEDMRLMKKANCNEMTLGIFAWTALEPKEGEFSFAWLDKAMDDIYNAGGRVILATPSGARPAWMSKKYPEVLRVTERNEQMLYGERHNHCYTSPVYRQKVDIINRRLAERYKNHPALIGWHISNEYGGECYCSSCKAEFRKWLKNKYGTLDNLNKQWWTAFWSHTFTDWEEIDPPSPLGDRTLHGKALDWKRFVTDQTADFMRNECRALREITPHIPITANLMGFYPNLDYRRLVKEIDFVSWDNYPSWQGNENDISVAKESAMTHDLMRSLNKRPFYLMESTPSLVNWQRINKLKRPGMHLISSLQAVAHGSDSVQYFQWRKSRGSSEKFHGAVVDHVGNEHTRVFKDVAEVGARLKALDEIVGSVVDSKVGILFDWDNYWAVNMAAGFQKENKKLIPTLGEYYSALWERGIDVDLLGAEDGNFSKYKLIIAPMRYMVNKELGEKLKAYVKAGGTLLCTYMTGMVNENDLCHLGGFPGAGLREVFGIWNEEIDTLYPEEDNTVRLTDGSVVKAVDYCEIIHLEGASPLAYYDSDFYKGSPAATVNSYGKGKAYYVAFRDRGDYTDRLVEKLLTEADVTSSFDGNLPNGVTAHSRTDGKAIYVFIENYNSSQVNISTSLNWKELETDKPISGNITLAPLQTLILKA